MNGQINSNQQDKLTVAWLRTMTWMPRPCSLMSSSNTCSRWCTCAFISRFISRRKGSKNSWCVLQSLWLSVNLRWTLTSSTCHISFSPHPFMFQLFFLFSILLSVVSEILYLIPLSFTAVVKHFQMHPFYQPYCHWAGRVNCGDLGSVRLVQD